MKKKGRPTLEVELQIRRNITISDRIKNKAKKIGGGNLSQGLRISVDKFNVIDNNLK